MWFDKPLAYPGKETPDGPMTSALIIAATRDSAPVAIDAIGVGSSPLDFLRQAKQQVLGVNVAEKATGLDKTARMKFYNQRSELWWRMREALDPTANTGIALPPDPRLKADLCAPKWTMQGASLRVEGREDIQKRIGRSPDYASAYCLALMDIPKIDDLRALNGLGGFDYDPVNPKLLLDDKVVMIHPHPFNHTVWLDLFQYRFVDRFVKLFSQGRVQLSHFIQFKEPNA